MTTPPDWAVSVPSHPGIHNLPARNGGEPVRPYTDQQVHETGFEWLEQFLRRVVEALAGVFIPGDHGAAFAQLQAWAADIPILGDFIEVLTGVEDGDLTDLGTWVLNLQSSIDSFWRSVIEYNLNVLTNPLLETAEALEDDENWSWDNTIRHQPVGGSATVMGDGVVHELGSDPILPVAPGQNIMAHTWVRWRDIVCDGPAFELVLYRYDGTTPTTAVVVGEEILESFSDPVADSAEFLNNDFIKLDGNYTITDTDTKGVRLVWRQTANVTAGQSWWHDASMTKANDDFTRKMQNIDLDGNFDLTKVFNQLPAEQVEGVGGTPDIGQSVTDTWNSLVAGLLGLFGITGQTPADVESAANTVSNTANTALYSTETNSAFFNQPRVLPAWIGSLRDDVCFSRASVDGTTTPTLGTLVLIPVTITSDRTVDALKVGMTASGMTNLYVGLWDCDETTGDMSKVLDLGDRKADLDLGFSVQTFELDEPIGVQQGEVYFIGVLQVGGSASPMHRDSRTTIFTDGFFPEHLGNTWSTTGISTLPASIDADDVVSGTRYWGAIGTAVAPVAPAGLFFSDSFNRADNSTSLGASWTIRSGAGGISSNKPSAALFNTLVATYNSRLSGDTQRVGWTQSGTPSASHFNCVTLRGNGSGDFVELVLSIDTSGTDHVYINTHTAYSRSGGTQRASETISPFNGNWTFEAVGNVYRGYQNGVLKIQWTDSGTAFPVTSANTEVGFVTNKVGGNTMDDWFAQDV